MNALTLNLHILAGCLLVGGSLAQALVVLPQARRAGDPGVALDFLRRWFPWTLLAILIQAGTGPQLAMFWSPEPANWFPGGEDFSPHVFAKLFCLAVLIGLVLHGRFRTGPRVARGDWGIRALAWQIGPQALLAVCFAVLGVLIRLGH